MPMEVTSWKASDGTLHENECDAAKRDIELLVIGSPLAENAPFARKLMEWLAEDHSEIVEVLASYKLACAIARTDSTSENGRKGPVTGTQDGEIQP